MANKAITTSHVPMNELSKELEDIFTEFSKSSFEVRQKAIQAGAEVFKKAIEAATPTSVNTADGGPHMKDCWMIKDKYKDRRYVGNTKVANGDVRRKTTDGSKGEARSDVPLSNVLEYAEKSPHKGFIRNCFDSNEAQIFDAIKKTIENGGK